MTQVAVQTTAGTSPVATEILFVDAGLPDSEILLAGLAPQVEVVRLAGDRGGLEQISWTLAGRTGVAALHILGHGRAGQIDLGDGVLSLGNLAAASADLSAWRQSLADGADILVYGCDVAGSADGAALIAQMAQLTGADVAAPTDATGAAALGGNWTLEMQTGPIEAGLPFSAQATAAWQHTLNHFRYGTMSWEPVAGSPNTVVISGQVDWTNDHGFIPSSTPIGGVLTNKFVLDFGDGTTQQVALRVLTRDSVTDDVLTEFVSDLDGDGTIGAGEVGIRHTYASAGNYQVTWGSSAREGAIGQNGSTWQQDMRIDLGQAGNSSPVVATPAVVQVVDDTTFTYQIAASDPDGNPLRFRYGTQDEFYKNGITTEATRPTGLTLTAGGLITWDVHDTTLSTATGDRWQVTIMAEDLDFNGNVRSFVPVDFVLQIAPAGSQPPVFTQLPSGPQQVTPGQISTFTVEMDDPDSTAAPAITVLNPPSTDPAIFSTTSSVDGAGKTTLTISFRPTAAMEGNSYVVNIRGRDDAGLTTDQSITLTVPDITPPAIPSALALTTPSDTGLSSSDRITNDNTPTVTGVTDPGSIVTVLVDGAAAGTATANSAGVWSFTPGTALTDGGHTLTATATDSAGNVSAVSAALPVTIDTVAPDVPAGLLLAAASDSGTAGDDLTNATLPVITGTAGIGAGDRISLYAGATLIGAGTAAADGTWSITATSPLSPGANALTATATDMAGNVSTASSALNVTLDTIALPPSLLLAAASDTGAVGDGITNVATPTLTGTAEANSTVTLSEGASLLGTAQADSAGLWSFTPVTALAEGVHSITATAADAAGNVSVPSTLALTIDTGAPAAPAVLAVAPASDSGVLGDGVTSVAAPTLTGTAEANSTVTLSDGATVLGTAQADGAGLWSFTPAGALAEGAHSVTAITADAAGNASPVSAAFALTIDTAGPAAPAALAIAPGDDSGTVGDGITGIAIPMLIGTAEAGSTVTLSDGATVLGTAVADADGRWSFTPIGALAEGAHSITATATDAAGNASPTSAALALTIDSTAPGAPTSLALTPGSDSGVAGDRRTNIAAPTLAGTAEANSTVTLTDGASVLGTAQADGAGLWSFTPRAALAEGAHSIAATATDAAGNASAASATLALTIDTTAPAVAMALARDTGLDYDRITSDPALTGSADPGDTVTLSEGGATLGTAVADAPGAWSYTPAGLAEGAHAITASDTDAAGNTGQASLRFVLDTSAPTTDYTLVDGSGVQSEGVLTPAGQAVPGVARGFAYAGTGGATILARADNAMLKGGTGGDAIVAQGGRSVLDGNGGSDWLVGGTGQNSFVVDARGGTWNTVLGFKAGDDIAVRGIQEVASTFRWVGTAGASGYQGATLRGTPSDTGQAFSVTFAGLTVEQAKRYAAVVERETDGTPVLRLRAASPSAPDDASYAITNVTTGVASDFTFDPYQGTAAGLRYQHVESGDAPAVLLAKASDSLLKSGAGNDALAVRNGDNVLDAGSGSNWLVGGAGNDKFLVDARGGQPVWNTVVNFHAGDELVMRGYQEGVSSWSWTALKEGAAGYEGATLRGALNGRDTDFSLTLAGISVEQARGFAVSSTTTSDGVGALSIRA